MTPEQYRTQLEQECLNNYRQRKGALQQGLTECGICGQPLHFRWAYAWGTEWIKCSNADCIDYRAETADYDTRNTAILSDGISKQIDSNDLGRLVSKPARKKLLVKSQPKVETPEPPKRRILVTNRKIIIRKNDGSGKVLIRRKT